MFKERKDTEHIKEEEFVRTFLMFRSFPPEKRAYAIAFINGMEFQENMSKEEKTNSEQPRKPPKQPV